MPSLLTAAGTLVFYSPAHRALCHGDFRQAPRNLSIAAGDGRLRLGWLAEGKAESAEFLPGQAPGKCHFTLRQGTEWLVFEPGGSLRHSPAPISGQQEFLLLAEQEDEDLLYLLAHRWSLLSPIAAEKLPRLASLGANFSLQLCGKTIALDDAGLPFPSVTQATRQHPGEVIFQYADFLVGRARLYNPLIYFCVFGDNFFVLLLTLFFRTFAENAGYDGKILIVTDRAAADLHPVIPDEYRERTGFVQRNYTTVPEFAAARYDFSDLGLPGHQPVLYCDIDMVCTDSIVPMLLDILHADTLCFSAEHTDLPDLWNEHAEFTNWYGRPLFDADVSWAGPAKHQNSGIFGFTHIARTEIAFRFILSVIRQYKQHGDARIFSHDQAYTSYTLQKLGLSEPEFLNRHVQVLSDKHADPAGPLLPLVHFNYGVGNTAKFDEMAKFYAGILARQRK